MSAGALFLSYAREDTDAARRIADALRSHGVEVFFDQSELRGGDAWDQKLRRQIKECALFVPIVSAHTQQRREGYFRLEWKLAVERTHLMAEGSPFLAPVVVDDTAEGAAVVPAEFMRVQWTRLPGALVTPQFVEQIKRLLASPSSPSSAASAGAPSVHASQSTTPKSGFPTALIAGLAVVVLALVGYIALRPANRETPPTPGSADSNAASVPKPAADAKSTPPAPSSLTGTPSSPAAKPAGKSIAVLPFANMSDDKDSGFFADGVHEDILTHLALIRDFKVVSRTTVTQYRGTKKSMRQIGEELGVVYILEGSVRRAGNKVRVTGQLIDARTDEHVWADSFDRDLTDVFAIQAALATEIARALKTTLSPETQKLLSARPTENTAAYDLFLKGRDTRNRMRSGTPAPLKQAEKFFQGAVEQDPRFAAAWGELAVVHALHVFWEIDHTPGRLAQADAAIAHAVRLAPESPDVIRTLGTYAYYGYRDYARATAQYEKLARLQPNDPTVFYSLGLIQRREGRTVEAALNLRKAVELDPGNVSYLDNLVQFLATGRLWAEARALHRRLMPMVPERRLREELYRISLGYFETGSTAEGDTWFAALTPAERESPEGVNVRKQWVRLKGDFAEWKRLDRVHPFFDGEGVDRSLQAIRAAVVYAATGEPEAARARLADFPAELRARMAREPANSRVAMELGRIEAVLGNVDEAVRLARRACEMLPESKDAYDGAGNRLELAKVYAITGQKEKALAELTYLLRVPSNLHGVHWLKHEVWFTSLHSDPRFQALLKDPKNSQPLF